MVTELWSRLDRLEGLRSPESNSPPQESGSLNDGSRPGPGSGSPSATGGAPQRDHTSSRRGSGSECEEWLSADYRSRRGSIRTPARPRRPMRAREPAPPAYGVYGVLSDEVPE